RIPDDLVVGGQRADLQRPVGTADPAGTADLAYAAQFVQPADVHQQLRVGQPQPKQRQQALSAGDDLGVLTAVGQGLHGIGKRNRSHVVELSRDHAAPPFATLIARQTRCGVHGISMSVTPSGRSASMMALTTAGVEAIVPASPTPLTPSGFVVAGVSVRSVSNVGRSAADGTR